MLLATFNYVYSNLALNCCSHLIVDIKIFWIPPSEIQTIYPNSKFGLFLWNSRAEWFLHWHVPFDAPRLRACFRFVGYLGDVPC